jgi:outer membrane receptor protein involved in Fe transport
LRGAASWARHTYANNPALSATALSGNEIDTAPKMMGSMTLDWQTSARWQNQLTWVHLGEYYTNPENTNQYPGHHLIHWHGQFQLSDQVAFFFRVHNLTDKAYAERADFAFGNERFFVGLPRSLYLGVRFR